MMKQIVLPLFAWTLIQCGVQKETAIENPPSQSKGTGSEFVVGGGKSENAEPVKGQCQTDLRQDVIINPNASGITALFSGKLDPACVGSKKLVLLIYAPGEFSVAPEYRCLLSEGEFNVKCTGPLVRLSEGNFSISLTGGPQFNSQPIRMKLSVE
jgi:hypothetical protein